MLPTSPEEKRTAKSTKVRKFQHAILDIKTPLAGQLDSKGARRLVSVAAHAGGLKVLKISSHDFGANAFTLFALLSQSHISLHTWPEYDYVACDVFSCGGELELVVRRLLDSLTPESVTTRILPRGIPAKSMSNTIFVDGTGPGIRTVYDVRLVHSCESKFQRIQVMEHQHFGKMLVINDDVQFSQMDHALYDESLLSPLKSQGKCDRILIIGGGDGLCCTYLVNHKIGSKIDVFELDPEVRQVCLKYFGKLSVGIQDRKVHVRFGDATNSISQVPNETYDAVIVDTTAPDTRWGSGTYTKAFLGQCRRVLRPDGMLTMNGTSLWYDYELDARDISKNIQAVFRKAKMSTAWIPSFGSPWAFFVARKNQPQ